MSYPSAPAPSFGNCPYLITEHSAAMKSAYQNDTRAGSDYMRVDFNPIIESLNFVPNASTYEAIVNNNFGTWPLNCMDDAELKARSGFSLHCQPGDYCNQLGTVSDHTYNSNNRRLTSNSRLQDEDRLDTMTMLSQNGMQPSFQELPFNSINSRAYNPKLFTLSSTPAMTTTNPRAGLDLTRSSTKPNHNPLLRSRLVNQNAPNPNQVVSMSTNVSPLSNPVLMTPDSSTTGFLTQKFGGSSDDGEISPTPTNSSSQPRTAGRARKAAPTLATGRRNLKNEPVDPDEADRRMKRRERNRKSAQKCRERKVQRTQELQAQVDVLQREINRLLQERETLRNEARQFVTLLQLHCPGVAVPYMACLNENPDVLNVRRESHAFGLHSVDHVKEELSQETAEWRLKQKAKMDSDMIDFGGATDPYTNSGLPVQSQVQMNHNKPSMFTYQVDRSITTKPIVCSNANQQNNVNASSEQTGLENSHRISLPLQGIPSASSSSPGSNYELSFNTNDGSTSLSNQQLELAIEMVHTTPNSRNGRNTAVLNSPNCLPSLQPTSVNSSTATGELACQKCDEWDQLSSVRSDLSSPSNTSISLKHFVRCDVPRHDQQALSTNPCYS